MKMHHAVSVISAQRLWQSMAGLITLLIITTRLTPEEQGWYYTLTSFAALYSVFEMGLNSTILQIVAQKFVTFNWFTESVSDFEFKRSGAFASKSFQAYIFSDILFLILIYPLGVYVFSSKPAIGQVDVLWLLPWTLLLLFTGLSFLVLPFISIVEGTGAIVEVYTVRFAQSFVGSLLCWTVLWNGFALWATTMMSFAAALVGYIWLSFFRKSLLQTVKNSWASSEFDWQKEVWPLQWRVGVGWISVYLWSQLATPIVFFYQGPVEAGQIGLSLTIAHMVGIFAQSWIARGVPFMGQAVARNDWGTLMNIFARDLKSALLVFLMGAVGFLLFLHAFSASEYANRVLPEGALIALLAFVLFYLLNGALASQLRSFKKEPLVWVFVLGGILTLVLSVWAARYSASAVVYVMLAVQMLLVFPCSCFIWKTANRKFQAEGIAGC